MLSPEKYGNVTPTRPPGFPDDDVADILGMAFDAYWALSVVLSGISAQSFGVTAPRIIELRIIIELLAN